MASASKTFANTTSAAIVIHPSIELTLPPAAPPRKTPLRADSALL
jgi:hypothetical protein